MAVSGFSARNPCTRNPVSAVPRYGRVSDHAQNNLVRHYGVKIGHPKLSPHDLRRTYAKLARKGGAALEDISLALGHASIATTERYLCVELNLDHAAPDAVKLRP